MGVFFHGVQLCGQLHEGRMLKHLRNFAVLLTRSPAGDADKGSFGSYNALLDVLSQKYLHPNIRKQVWFLLEH